MDDIPHIIEVSLFLVIAFLLGCILGFLLRKIPYFKPKNLAASANTRAASEKKVPPTPEHRPSPKTAPASAATTPDKPAPSQNDLSKEPAQEKPIPTPPAEATSSAPTPEPAANDEPENNQSGRPETLEQPRNNKKDNLRKIKGIGPKIESVLNDLGVFHFDQISSWNQQTIDWVDDYLSFKGRIERDDWVGQARELARAE